MADPRVELGRTLEQLHAQLEETEVLDEALRRELRAALAEIGAALERSEPGSLEPSLLDRLSDLAVGFEGSHPRLTETVGRLAKALADLGI